MNQERDPALDVLVMFLVTVMCVTFVLLFTNCAHKEEIEVVDIPCEFHSKHPDINRYEQMLGQLCAEGNIIACEFLQKERDGRP